MGHKAIDLDNDVKQLIDEMDRLGARITHSFHSLSCRVDKCIMEIRFQMPVSIPNAIEDDEVHEGEAPRDNIHKALSTLFETTDTGFVTIDRDDLYDNYRIGVSTLGIVNTECGNRYDKSIRVFRRLENFNLDFIEPDLQIIVRLMTEVLKSK